MRISLTALCLLCLVAASPAVAAEPEVAGFSYSGSGPFYTPSGTVVTCGGATVMSEWVMYGTTATWLDAEGNLLRLKLHAKTEETWFLDPDSGKKLWGRANYSTFTLTPGVGLYQGVEKWTGLFWYVVAPGVGTALLDAGLEIIDWNSPTPVVKASGRHQWLDGDFEKLCAALQ